jgi:hypothetical protein
MMTEAKRIIDVGVAFDHECVPPRRREQMAAIKAIVPERDGYAVRYDPRTDSILIGNDDLAFAMTGRHLDDYDHSYLDVVRDSFASLVEAIKLGKATQAPSAAAQEAS